MSDDALDPEMLKIMHERLSRAPFHQWLGLVLVDCGQGWVEFEMPWRDEIVSVPEPPTLHGGISASLIDMGGLAAIRTTGANVVGTIYMHVDYHRGGRPGPIITRGEIVKVGKTMGVAEAKILQDGHLIASGRGGYRIKEA